LANEIQPADLGHDVVDDQDVERALAEQTLRLPRGGRLDHAVAGVPQGPAQRPQNLLFVVYEQDGSAMSHECARLACAIRSLFGGVRASGAADGRSIVMSGS